MFEDLQEVFHEMVRWYLEETHGYDFVSEVLEIEEVTRIVDDDEGPYEYTHLEVSYRGINGEYSTLLLDESLRQLMAAIS